MFVDAHCHLADPRLDGQREALLARAHAARIGFFIQGGVDPGDWARQRELADKRWLACFGIHPWFVAQSTSEALEKALALLPRFLPEAFALGELGLDFHPRFSPDTHQTQIRYFGRQLEMALAWEKPLILHLVRSHGEALSLLKPLRGSGLRGLVHGFTGGYEVAREYLDLGLLISVGGALTRKGYRKLKQAVSRIPLEQLVIESDAPDMMPHGRSGPFNEPSFLWDTARAVAEIKGRSAETVLALARQNLGRHFGWEFKP